MGIVNFGIPLNEANYLREKMKLDIAVEGGTYKGGTAKELSQLFEKVYTIEKSETMYDEAKTNLAGIVNIELLKGDTRTHLPSILDNEDHLLFWLDAHWSGGATYGEKDECPLIEELRIIFESGKICAILIDDARLFMAPPPSPHEEAAWPSLADVALILPEGWDLMVWNDVIYITPKSIVFRKYMQQKATAGWIAWSKNSYPTFANCARGLLHRIFRK